MALNTYSAFYYGHTIVASNRYLNFSELYTTETEQRTAIIPIGSYTLQQFADVIATAMNEVSSQEYSVTLDRTTRRFTISAPNNFELLLGTGNNKTISVFSLLGFTSITDLTGSNSYEGDIASGQEYITQTPLSNFSDFSKNKEKAEAIVKTTLEGLTEVISYSTLERMKCDFSLITNYTPQRYVRETSTGIEEAEAFLDYAISKAPLEFISNFKEPNKFVSCILDKTAQSRSGVGYELREKVRDKLPGYFEIKGLVFRKIEVR